MKTPIGIFAHQLLTKTFFTEYLPTIFLNLKKVFSTFSVFFHQRLIIFTAFYTPLVKYLTGPPPGQLRMASSPEKKSRYPVKQGRECHSSMSSSKGTAVAVSFRAMGLGSDLLTAGFLRASFLRAGFLRTRDPGLYAFVLIFLIAVLGSSITYAQPPSDTKRYEINIPAGNAAEALNLLAEQTDTILLFPYRDAEERQANAVVGRYTLMEALSILLKNSGLVGGFSANGAIRISTEDAARFNLESEESVMNTKKKMLAGLVGFFVGSGVATHGYSATSDEENYLSIDEVIVTAQKREQRLIDVPISITVIGEEVLEDTGINDLNELSYYVPNLSVVEISSGVKTVYIRGVGNGVGSSPLVGVYIDEAPVTMFPSVSVDLQVLDLERAEVLKGPQGTFYGQGSVGGTVRFLANKPDFEGYDAELGLSMYNTQGGDWSEEISVTANLPLINDVLAFRVAAEHKNRGGWIDQPATDTDNANDSEMSNIRLKGLWQVSDDLNVDALMIRYRNNTSADNVTNIGSVKDSNYEVVSIVGEDSITTGGSNDYDLYNLTIKYEFEFGDFVSSSSSLDATNKVSPTSIFANFAFDPMTTYDLLATDQIFDVSGFTQELRLSSNESEGEWEWVVGVFYSDIKEDQMFTSGTYVDGIPAFGPAIEFSQSNESVANSIFGNVGYELSDRISLSIGTRYFENEKTFLAPNFEPLSENFYSLSSRFSLSYILNEKMMTFLTISEGFRSGGFNVDGSSYEPENVISYELGAKSSMYGGSIQVEAAFFHSEYSDYQGSVFDPSTVTNFIDNSGEAEIQGVEFSAVYLASEYFNFGVNGSFTDAEFIKVSNLISQFNEGDPVSFIPEYNYSLYANLDFHWAPSIKGFSRIDFSRQGPNTITDRLSGLLEVTSQSSAINYLNAQIGAQLGAMSIKLFGKNLTNEKRATTPDLIKVESQNRPRNFGIDFNYTF